MNRYLQFGNLIAFLIGIIFILNTWELFYQPGELGANIFIILILIIFLLYVFTKNFGLFLNELILERGSIKKALFIFRAKNRVELFKKKIKKISRKNKFLNSANILIVKKTLDILESHLHKSNKNFDKIQDLLTQSEHDSKFLFKKLSDKDFFEKFKSIFVALFISFIIRLLIIEPFQIPSSSMVPTLLIGDHVFALKLSYGIINPFPWQQYSYLIRWSTPKPGDVVIFKAPSYTSSNIGADWVKRVIACAGQTVSIKNGIIYVDNKPYIYLLNHEKILYYDYLSYEKKWQSRTAFLNKESIKSNIVHQTYTNKFLEFWPTVNKSISKHQYPGLECNKEFCKIKEGFVFVMGDNRENSADSRFWGALSINNIHGKVICVWVSIDGRKAWFKVGKFSLPIFRLSRILHLIA